MLIEIDFNSNEAIYVQLQNQIIMGIATDAIREGDTPVRQTAGRYSRNQYAHSEQSIFDPEAGRIYSAGQKKGAVVAIDADKAQAMLKLREKLAILLAKGCCKNISREDVHALVDEIFDEYRR